MNKFYLKSADALLLIIDMQEKLLPAMPYRDQAVKNTNLLLELAKACQMPVVLTEQYPQGLGRTVEEIRVNCPPVRLIEKMTFSAYTPELADYLQAGGRRQVIVAGTETHVCVYQTARDLLKEGYTVFLCADAVASRFNLNYHNSLDLLRQMGAVVTNTETAIFDILRVAGTPEFKAMSRLLK